MEITNNVLNDLIFEEVESDELYGDGWFIAGAVGGVVVGGVIWGGLVLT